MTASAKQRVTDWLESGVAALCGFIPPGSAATQARSWSQELESLAAAMGHSLRVDGAQLLAERAALTGDGHIRSESRGSVSSGGACRLLRCADGWVAVSLPRESDLDLIAPLVEAEVSDPWEALTTWVSGQSAAGIVARGSLLGIALSQVGEGAAPLRLPLPSPARQKVPLVVDFSALWAGPLCTSLLGQVGARVVKVESVSRLDGARRGEPRFYDLLHAGQESVTVDPEDPADRKALQSLVGAADVVIESSRPRALAGWGLDAQAAATSGTVWVSITAYGRGQPDRVGFGDDVAAGAGLVGEDQGAPVFVGDAIADPLTGLAGAVAALRALGGGDGVLIDLAMASVVASTLDGSPAGNLDGLRAEPPRARVANGKARPPGADTTTIFEEFR